MRPDIAKRSSRRKRSTDYRLALKRHQMAMRDLGRIYRFVKYGGQRDYRHAILMHLANIKARLLDGRRCLSERAYHIFYGTVQYYLDAIVVDDSDTDHSWDEIGSTDSGYIVNSRA